jgi:hypothetical protein
MINVKIILIYLVALFFAFTSKAEEILNYDVEWPKSKHGEYHLLKITLNECQTLIKIKHDDLENFSSNDKNIKQALQKAKQNLYNGCKNDAR